MPFFYFRMVLGGHRIPAYVLSFPIIFFSPQNSFVFRLIKLQNSPNQIIIFLLYLLFLIRSNGIFCYFSIFYIFGSNENKAKWREDEALHFPENIFVTCFFYFENRNLKINL